ncbi:uncharacterized protein LOC132552902 [Ylistrum balloti]|uniref:uncharacterized protein LOC132552902 n=1 Tax=Ylistrum balloti TaxID=509963 RepID=UPI002905B28E|nr:uncharacterized protein LOC132552902 [Ylistrum balloti]
MIYLLRTLSGILVTILFLGGALSQEVLTDLDFLCSLSSPCEHGATCSVKDSQIYCICPDGFTGSVCENFVGLQQSGNVSPTPISDIFGTSTSNTEPGNSGRLVNGPVVEGSAAPDMGLGGAMFRLGSSERNLNPDLHSSLGSVGDFRLNSMPVTGNIAGGLSNQQPQHMNRPMSGNHVIQQNLKDRVILHNFVEGGIQEMLMGSPNQPSQAVNQAHQIKELINSPKKIKDAFPDQKLVDGNAVAVGSTGTAVGATFQDPTQQANDLPSSFTPKQQKPMHDANMIDFSNHACKGQHREHLLNSKMYWVVEKGKIIAKMACPLGTLFSNVTCACTFVPSKPKDAGCKPDLINTFDYGMDDSSGNFLAHFASKDLKPTLSSGVLCFNGSQKMGYPRYNGYDFRYSLYIVLRFVTYVKERDQLFPLLTNCETNMLTGEFRDPSIGIVLNRTNHLVIFIETDTKMSLTAFEINVSIT